MYHKFIQALTWNSINIFAYKAILLTHQVILFYFLPTSVYGTSGSIFALIYLMIGFTGFGFEYTLYTFFAHHRQSKAYFKQLVPQYLTRLITILIVACGLWIVLNMKTHAKIINFWAESIPHSLLPYLLLIFISESIKRSLETLAQLSFLNKQIATIQISMITLYVLLFWIGYWITGYLTLHNIFIPMAIMSYAEVMLLFSLLYSFYQSLPEKITSNKYKPLHNNMIVKDQLYNYINQVGKSFFSPNFLMTIIAYNLGMTQAGNIRFFTNIITLLYMLLNRSIGIPSGALLSNMTQQAFDKTKQVFLDITNTYIQFLYILALITAATVVPRLISIQSFDTYIMYHVLFFIFSGFTEYLTLTYEKLYITQKASKYLAAINSIGIILLIIAVNSSLIAQHQRFLLLPICIIRVCSAFIIGYLAYHKWSIKPKLTIAYKTILISIISTIIIKYFMYVYQVYLQI